jgi:hypothetical protein
MPYLWDFCLFVLWGVQHMLCFCFICFPVVSYVSNVAILSGFSIFDCPFRFL